MTFRPIQADVSRRGDSEELQACGIVHTINTPMSTTLTRRAPTMSKQPDRRLWTTVTWPASGEIHTVYRRLEKSLREGMGLPSGRPLAIHTVCLIAMKALLEQQQAEKAKQR